MTFGKRLARIVRWCISIVLTLTVGVFIVHHRTDLLTAISNVKTPWVVLGLVCYALNYGLRAMRFYSLSNGALFLWPEGIHAACLHGFATYMMPFRTGDLTLPIILRSISKLSLTESSRLLISARFLDLQTLGIWVVIAASVLDKHLSVTLRIVWLGIGLAMVILPLALNRLGAISRGSRLKVAAWLGQFTANEPMNKPALMISVAIWTAVAGCYFCVVQAIGLPLDFMQIWLLVTIQLPMQLLPIQGLANTGNHEGGWVAALLLFGISAEAAMEFALLSHALFFLFVLTLGPTALITGYLRPTTNVA